MKQTIKMFCPALAAAVASLSASADTYTNTVTDVEGKPIKLEWTYTVSGGKVTLEKMTNLDETAGFDLREFPSESDFGGTLTTLGSAAFRDNTALKSVTLPTSVKTINDGNGTDNLGTFTGCSSLTNVVMPNVETVGRGAFRLVSSLVHIGMPQVKKVNQNAFYGAEKLAGDFQLDYLSEIGANAFQGTAITSIKMPAVTKFNSSVFVSCTSLTNVVMPKIQSMGTKSFHLCTNLVGDVFLPELTTIIDEAFRVTRITSIKTPLVKDVQNRAFHSDLQFTIDGNTIKLQSAVSALTNAVLPCVRTINYQAFCNTINLKEIKLPWCLEKCLNDNNSAKAPFSGSGITNFLVHAMSPLALTNETDDVLRTYVGLSNDKLEDGVTPKVAITRYGGVVTNEWEGANGVIQKAEWFYDDRDTSGYALSEKEVTIVGSTNATGAVVMPDKVTCADGKTRKVTAVGDAAFYYNTSITTNRLGKYVTRVGIKAFNPPAKNKGKLTVEVPEGSPVVEELAEEYATAIANETFEVVTYKTNTGLMIIVK